MIRTIVVWGLYCGPHILGNYHVSLICERIIGLRVSEVRVGF